MTKKLVVTEIDNKKNERINKDSSDHVFKEKITMRKCEKRRRNVILPEEFTEAPCMMVGEKKVNYICVHCRMACDTSLCEDIDEVHFQNMSTNRKYI